MILSATFATPDAALAHFNAPANAALRLVNLLPPLDGATLFTAIYDDAPADSEEESLDTTRLRWLEEYVLKLLALDDGRKLGLNFPRAILDVPAVPLAIVANKLQHLAAFEGMDTPARTAWVREHVAEVGCTLISKDEARLSYNCGAELIRIDE